MIQTDYHNNPNKRAFDLQAKVIILKSGRRIEILPEHLEQRNPPDKQLIPVKNANGLQDDLQTKTNKQLQTDIVNQDTLNPFLRMTLMV